MRKSIVPELDAEIGQMLFHASPVGVVLVSKTNHILRANRAFCHFLGYTEQDLKSKSVHDIAHPDDWAEFSKRIRRFWAKGWSTGPFEARYRHKSGKVVWGQVDGCGGGLGGKKARFRIVQIADITERKQTEESLRRAELDYRTTLNAMGDAIHVVDSDLRIVLFNQTAKAWDRRLGLPTNVIGRTVFEVFPFLPGSVRKQYEQVFKRGVTLHTEETNTVDGRKIATETWKIPICEDGKVVKVVTVFRDVTRRKEAEAVLRRQAQIMDQVHDAVVVTDINGVITNWNKSAERLFGFTEEAVKGKHVSLIYPNADNESLIREQIAALKAEGEHRAEVPVRKATGDSVFVDLSLTLLRDANGVPMGMIGCSKDITERKEAAAQLRKALDELEQKVKDRTAKLRALAVQLDQAEQQERRRVTHILHDDLQQILVAARYHTGRPEEASVEGGPSEDG